MKWYQSVLSPRSERNSLVKSHAHTEEQPTGAIIDTALYMGRKSNAILVLTSMPKSRLITTSRLCRNIMSATDCRRQVISSIDIESSRRSMKPIALRRQATCRNITMKVAAKAYCLVYAMHRNGLNEWPVKMISLLNINIDYVASILLHFIAGRH